METTDPPSEKTLAIMKGLEHLQDVSRELREIRRLLEAQQNKSENKWTALKRAVNQFFSQA